MSALGVTRRGRRAAERLMVDRCVVRRPTGEVVTDPDTHKDTPVLDVVYGPGVAPFFGRFKVASYEAFEQERESAGSTQMINRLRIDLPVGSFLVKPNDVVTVLESVDSLLVGQHYRLTVQAPYKSHATAYRVSAELNVGMEVPAWAEQG